MIPFGLSGSTDSSVIYTRLSLRQYFSISPFVTTKVHLWNFCWFKIEGIKHSISKHAVLSMPYPFLAWSVCTSVVMHLAVMVVYNSNIINMYHAFLWWIELIFRFPMDGIHLVLQGDVLHVLWLSFYAFTRSGSTMTACGSHAYHINTWE